MNFSLTDDQQLIRESASDFLARASDSAAVRRALDSDTGHDPALWAQMAGELGWCSTGIPEAHGGLGMGSVELALLMEQMGRHLACTPFFSTVVLASTALLLAGSEQACAHWLPKIAAGELRATLALAGRSVGLGTPGVRGVRTSKGWSLDGHVAHVPDGSSATLILVLASLADGELALFAVTDDAPGLARTKRATWDETRHIAEVALTGVQVGAHARVDDGALLSAKLQAIEGRAALLLAAEQLGGAQQCLDLTLAYTAERTQFGQKIASFQAVKHRCAQMMVEIEATRSLVYGAAALADSGGDGHAVHLEAGAAKARASETFFFCAQEAIQLHGGVGFTWEYDPHLYFKRAQASSQWLGTPDLWRERIASALLDGT